MILEPAPVLSVLVGFLHACLFVVVRGIAGRRFLPLLGAAILGAWAGDAAASRLDVDPLRLGDFHLAAASLVAWVGILVIATMSTLAASGRPERPAEPGIRTTIRRGDVPEGRVDEDRGG